MESSWRSRVCIWEHLARHLELPEVSHTVIFLPYCLSFSELYPLFSLVWVFFFFGTFHPISSAVLVLLLHISSCLCRLFIPSFFFFFLFVTAFSWFLSRHLFLPCLPLIFFPPLQHMSFSHPLCSGKNPVHRLAETFSGIVNKCLQHCADMSRCGCYSCEKAQAANPVKQGNQQAKIPCCFIHMVLCDAPLNPNTIKAGMRHI